MIPWGNPFAGVMVGRSPAGRQSAKALKKQKTYLHLFILFFLPFPAQFHFNFALFSEFWGCSSTLRLLVSGPPPPLPSPKLSITSSPCPVVTGGWILPAILGGSPPPTTKNSKTNCTCSFLLLLLLILLLLLLLMLLLLLLQLLLLLLPMLLMLLHYWGMIKQSQGISEAWL